MSPAGLARFTLLSGFVAHAVNQDLNQDFYKMLFEGKE
jgi:hypothetical protein